MKREVYYQKFTVPASEVRASSPLDDPYYEDMPEDAWDADVMQYPTNGEWTWARVTSVRKDGTLIRITVERPHTDRPGEIVRLVWDPVTILRPQSTPPF